MVRKWLGRVNWGLLGVVAAALTITWPLLRTGYLADDSAWSLMPGMRRYHGITLLQAINYSNKIFFEAGRFFPLAIAYVYSVFDFLPHLLWYKLYVWALLVADVALFYVLVNRLSRSRAFAGLSSLAVLGLFQFRWGYDPIMGFSGLLPWVTLWTLASLVFLHAHLESGRKAHLVLSTLIYLFLLLTYEITVLFVVLYATLILYVTVGLHRESWRKAARTFGPFAVALAAAAGGTVFARLKAGGCSMEAYQPNFRPSDYFRSLGKQLAAALPLDYFIVDPQRFFRQQFPQWIPWATAAAVFGVVLLVAAASVARLSRELRGGSHPPLRLFGVLGLLFWVLPAMLIAASPKYQQVVCRGMGYLPVYIEYFGVGLLLASASALVLKACACWGRWPRRGALAVAALLPALVTALTFSANVRTIRFGFVDQPFTPLRYNAEAALQAGLAEAVPDGATVFVGDPGFDYWQGIYSQYFFCTHAGKSVRANWFTADTGQWQPSWFSFAGGGPAPDAGKDRFFYYRNRLLAENAGYVLLSELTAAPNLAAGDRAPMLARKARLFVRGDDEPFWLVGKRNGPGSVSALVIGRGELEIVRAGLGWTIYSLDVGPEGFDATSLELISRKSPLLARWADGFYPPEGPEDDVHTSWRWCRQDGTLHVFNNSDRPRTFHLNADLGCLEKAVVTIQWPDGEEIVTPPETPHVSKSLRLPPGLTCIHFKAEASRWTTSGGDRALYFAVSNFSLENCELAPRNPE